MNTELVEQKKAREILVKEFAFGHLEVRSHQAALCKWGLTFEDSIREKPG